MLLEQCPDLTHMIHDVEAKLSNKPHSHDIDYSEEERRLIEEQSQRLETWKKSPIGMLHTMKELQGPPTTQSEGHTTNTTKPGPLLAGETQPLQDGTRKLQIVFPSMKEEATQQQKDATVKDFGSQDKVKDCYKNLSKEELEMLHSLVKKLDFRQLQSETANATGGVSSDETISAHTTSSLPPSDTEGTLSTASEPTTQLASPVQTAPEPHPPSESQSAESSATSDVEPSLQPATEEPAHQGTVVEDGDVTANAERPGDENTMEHHHDNLDGEGTAFAPGMMAAHNPMAAMATMGHFMPPPAAGFMPTMLPAPISPYMMPPPQAVYYYQMLQQAHYNQMIHQSMAAAAISSPTLIPSNQEDGHFFYQQKHTDMMNTSAAASQDVQHHHHQAEVNVDPVEVRANTDHVNSSDEQLRGNSPLQAQADLASSQGGFPASHIPPVNPPHLDQAPQGISVVPSSFTSTAPIVSSSLHSLQSSNEDTSSSNSQLQFAIDDHPQITNPNKELLKVQPLEVSLKTEVANTSNKTNHSPRREKNNTNPTSNTRTSNIHSWKQSQSTKQDANNSRQSYNTQQQTQYRRKYDGDTIDHELSQMGMHNDFPNGIPSMVFSSDKRRKAQT